MCPQYTLKLRVRTDRSEEVKQLQKYTSGSLRQNQRVGDLLQRFAFANSIENNFVVNEEFIAPRLEEKVCASDYHGQVFPGA